MTIDGKTTKGISMDKAIRLLKGKAGESVKIGVRHPGDDKVEQLSLVRDVIHVPTVLGDHYKPDGSWDFMIDKDNKIGYVRLTHFSRHSAIELEKAVNELLEHGMKGLVLDLRFDPGGLFSQATEISDMFIDGGHDRQHEGPQHAHENLGSQKGRHLPQLPNGSDHQSL